MSVFGLCKAVALLSFFYPVRWMLQCLPWRLALKIGTLLGTLHAHCFDDQLTRRIRAGMQAVWGDTLSEERLQQILRNNLITRYKFLIDSFFFPSLHTELVERMVPTIEGRAVLDKALVPGQGCILLLSHFGSFGMLVAGLAFRGYRLHQVFTVAPLSPYRTWRWVEQAVMQVKYRCWAQKQITFSLWRPGLYLRDVYRRLCAGEALILYGDGSREQQFVKVDFMGHKLSLSTGPFKIAARTHVPLIPAFIIREADDTHRIILEDPIVLRDDDPVSLQQAAGRYAAVLASYARAFPDQWFSWARLRGLMTADGPELELLTGEDVLVDVATRSTWKVA